MSLKTKYEVNGIGANLHRTIGLSSERSMPRFRKTTKASSSDNEKLTPEEVRSRTFQRAGKLLAAKSRSIEELRERLLEGKRTSVEAVEEVIARLREYGYLDDERFAFGYASLKVRQRPVGRARLARDLKFKKVVPEAAEEALDLVYAETSEEELIDRAIEKRLRMRGRPKDRAEAKKLFDHLLRQGFPFELVSEKVRAAMNVDLEEE
ncbi:MAG TPA: regulatory protein RecX [Pyrinomonadaceae bacterium]|nr:regulatory protein RecX [Pyrinomonadaceae bacterium]